MLERASNVVNWGWPDKYRADLSRNPFLSRLEIVSRANRKSIDKGTIFLPATTFNSLGFSLPVLRSRKWRLALLANSQFSQENRNIQFGFSCQRKLLQKWRLKASLLTGYFTSWRSLIERNLGEQTSLSAYAAGLLQNDKSSFALGACLKHRSLSLRIDNEIEGSTTIQAVKSYPLDNRATLSIGAAVNLQDSEASKAYMSLSYLFPAIGDVQMTVSYEKRNQNIGLELSASTLKGFGLKFVGQGSGVLVNLSFKSPLLQLHVPILSIEGKWLLAFCAANFILGFFMRPNDRNAYEDPKKSQETRLAELRLIEDKAATVYFKQQASQGLLIEQALLGSQEQIQRLANLSSEQRQRQLIGRGQVADAHPRNFEIVDVTVSLRFMTQRGQLHLPQGPKDRIIAFPSHSPSDFLFLRYVKGKNQETLLQRAADPIDF